MSFKIICLVSCIIAQLVFSTNQLVGFSLHIYAAVPGIEVIKQDAIIMNHSVSFLLWVFLHDFARLAHISHSWLAHVLQKPANLKVKKLHLIQEIIKVREWIFRTGLIPNHWFLLTYFQFATKVLRGCYSPEAWTQATFLKLAETTWRKTRRKAARSCSDFQESIYSLDVFCTLCILFFG